MSLDRAAITSALRSWLLAATGLPDSKVILDYQPGPQPGWPYIAINPTLATVDQGMYDEEIPGDDVLTHVQRRCLTVSVNVYAAQGQAMAIAEAARDGLELESVASILSIAGLAMIDKGKFQNLSELLETQYVERFQFDCLFNASGTTVEDITTIGSVQIAGTLVKPDGSTVTLDDIVTGG